MSQQSDVLKAFVTRYEPEPEKKEDEEELVEEITEE
jgi:hypothetical protein